MPSLSDRLKSLGVQVGAQDLPSPKKAKSTSLEAVLSGDALQTPQGETFRVERRDPLGGPHGHTRLELTAPLDVLGFWAGKPSLADLPAEAFAFLDTETTGLSGGSGTYTFLIGAGRFIGPEFVLEQFFLRDPVEEPAQLAAFEAFLAPCQAIVTFNGKAFDVPLLVTRFLTHGWQPPFSDLIHLDLLHLARRLWRDRLPSRALGDLEAHILDILRSEQDVPGWEIPSLYFQYLLDGDAAPLKPVFYHNAMDVVSLAALMNHMAGLLSDPHVQASEHGADLIALGKLYEDLGDLDTAAQLYLEGLGHEDLPRRLLLDAVRRLARLHKRQGELAAAIQLWEQAAALHQLDAMVELAKVYEHRFREYTLAIQWTQTAIDLIQAPPAQNEADLPGGFARRQWLDELSRRLERLNRKTARDE
jgi:uncharacterized protein YprB with RNaseH-like and TPR domain